MRAAHDPAGSYAGFTPGPGPAPNDGELEQRSWHSPAAVHQTLTHPRLLAGGGEPLREAELRGRSRRPPATVAWLARPPPDGPGRRVPGGFSIQKGEVGGGV